MYELSEEISLDKNIKHNIEIVVDRLVVRPGIGKKTCRFHRKCIKSCRGASGCGCDRTGEPLNFSQNLPARTAESVLMRSSREAFSFNNPFGACPVCFGLGYENGV